MVEGDSPGDKYSLLTPFYTDLCHLPYEVVW